MRPLAAASYLLILCALAAFIFFDQPALPDVEPVQEARFRIDRAVRDIVEINAITLAAGGRGVGTTGNALARGYLRAQLQEAGLVVVEESFRDVMGAAMTNVIATLPGSRKEAILIGARHDLDGPGPGTIEGTAALATLLELARGFSGAARERTEMAGPPQRTIVFAFFDGGSYGSAGAAHYVESLTDKERGRLRAMISLDALGWKEGDAVLHPIPYRDRFAVTAIAPDWLVTRVSRAARARGESLAVASRRLGLAGQVLVRVVDFGYYGDDRPFLEKGVPALLVSDYSLGRGYPHTGTVADDLDQLGAERLSGTGRALEASLADLARAESLPLSGRDYLVVQPFAMRALRLTGDQLSFLAVLSLLPGTLLLVGRRAGKHAGAMGLLFAAFGLIFLGAVRADPVLFPALFAPTLLAAPMLGLSRPVAAWAYAASLLPALIIAMLLVPICLAGRVSLVLLSGWDIAATASLLSLALAQVVLVRLRPGGASRPSDAVREGTTIGGQGLALWRRPGLALTGRIRLGS